MKKLIPICWRQTADDNTGLWTLGDRDSYGDDTMMSRVLLLTTSARATTSQLRPAEIRISRERPRAADSRQSSAPDTWTGIILTTIAIKCGLNHGVNPRHFSPGQCWVSSLNHLNLFWWESIHQNDTIQSSLVVQPIQFRDFSGSV